MVNSITDDLMFIKCFLVYLFPLLALNNYLLYSYCFAQDTRTSGNHFAVSVEIQKAFTKIINNNVSKICTIATKVVDTDVK